LSWPEFDQNTHRILFAFFFDEHFLAILAKAIRPRFITWNETSILCWLQINVAPFVEIPSSPSRNRFIRAPVIFSPKPGWRKPLRRRLFPARATVFPPRTRSPENVLTKPKNEALGAGLKKGMSVIGRRCVMKRHDSSGPAETWAP